MRVLLLIAIAVAIYYAHGALSAEQALVFRRDVVTIVPAADVEVIEAEDPKTAKKKDAEERKQVKKPEPPRQPVAIRAEIRSDQVLKLDWVHSLKTLRNDMGMLILFDPPTNRALSRENMYATVDVLFINAEGTIIQIVPDLNLSQLRDRVTAKEPVRAWMYLQGGAVKAFNIKPGDQLNHPLFSPKPVVLQ